MEGLACVEDWEGFGINRLARCEYRGVEQFGASRRGGASLGCDVREAAAESAPVSTSKQKTVDSEANLWWQCNKAS